MEPDFSWGSTATNSRGNGHKVQLKFKLSSRTKPTAVMTAMKHCNGLPREAVESLSLKEIQNLSWQSPEQPHGFQVGFNFENDNALSVELDHMTSKDPFQPNLSYSTLILSQ